MSMTVRIVNYDADGVRVDDAIASSMLSLKSCYDNPSDLVFIRHLGYQTDR